MFVSNFSECNLYLYIQMFLAKTVFANHKGTTHQLYVLVFLLLGYSAKYFKDTERHVGVLTNGNPLFCLFGDVTISYLFLKTCAQISPQQSPNKSVYQIPHFIRCLISIGLFIPFRINLVITSQ